MAIAPKTPFSIPLHKRSTIADLHHRGLPTCDIERMTGCDNAGICSVLIELKYSDCSERNLDAFEVIG